jgi:hypothetical protein
MPEMQPFSYHRPPYLPWYVPFISSRYYPHMAQQAFGRLSGLRYKIRNEAVRLLRYTVDGVSDRSGKFDIFELDQHGQEPTAELISQRATAIARSGIFMHSGLVDDQVRSPGLSK